MHDGRGHEIARRFLPASLTDERVTALETFRCPTCLFVLTEPDLRRCPSCHKRLRRRNRPVVLGDPLKFGSHGPLHIDLVLAERLEADQAAAEGDALPVAPAATAADTGLGARAGSGADPVEHTKIYEPSQFDPEMRAVLDDLYRKARAEIDEEHSQQAAADGDALEGTGEGEAAHS
jgi:hypothetical protein